MTKIMIDAGHGGRDTGAVCRGRMEKDDNLRLALAVGRKLKALDIGASYTRTADIDQSVSEKAAIVNTSDADYFLSLHRGCSQEAKQYDGVKAQVYDHSGIKKTMAENVNKKLEAAGYQNLGVQENAENPVLRKVNLSGFVLEAGCIDNEKDNLLFDKNLSDIAAAVAWGIYDTLNECQARGQQLEEEIPGEQAESESPDTEMKINYRVQTGSFKVSANAENLLFHLQKEGFPAYIFYEEERYKVLVGAFANLDDAIRMEAMLRKCGYSTFLTT